jgi:hypothetical protein
MPAGGLDAVRKALEENMGLTLVKARRPVERLVLDPLPATAKAADANAQSAPAPGAGGSGLNDALKPR